MAGLKRWCDVSSVGNGTVVPAIGWAGWLRWMWRQLTSMRVALLLLLLLAVAALPGSMLPQRPQDPTEVARYLADNPTLGTWLDRLGFFDVFASPWFSAVYLLLFISLIGCIVPRVAVHARSLRSRPPRAPSRFTRFKTRQSLTVAAEPDQVATAAREILRRNYRAEITEEAGGAWSVAGERGYLRETGNLVFHIALVGVLVAMAASHLMTYRGQAVVVEGHGFANSVVEYDTFEAGAWVDTADLAPYSFVLDRFESEFTLDGAPRDFTAAVTVTDPDGAVEASTIKVNHPLDMGGTKVFLSGNGYAPIVTVRNAAGQVAFTGAVPFLPQDAVYTSRGVIKVPDTGTAEQLGLVGALLPSAEVTTAGARSLHPQPLRPMLVLTLWVGDLGLDTGVPQNAYELDDRLMTQVTEDGRPVAEGGKPVTIFVEPNQVVELPGGYGTLEYEDLARFVALDVRHDPAVIWVLVFALLAIAGLITSLFTPRRRVWVRARGADEPGRSVVEVAGLTRNEDLGLAGAVDEVVTQLRSEFGAEAASAPVPAAKEH